MCLPPSEGGLIQYGTAKILIPGVFDKIVSKSMEVLALKRARPLVLLSLICQLVLHQIKRRLEKQSYKELWKIRFAGVRPSSFLVIGKYGG